MSLDQEFEMQPTIESTAPKDTDSGGIRERENALRQKLEIQFEVMKLLGFLPQNFEPKNPDASMVDETVWGMWTDAKNARSNAEIFSDEYDTVLCDPVKLTKLKTVPEEITRELAAKLRSKMSFLN